MRSRKLQAGASARRPASPHAREPVPSAAEAAKNGDRRTSRKLLVADDEEHVRLLLRVALEVDGYEVLTAADGEQVIQVALTERPDLIILDNVMPRSRGWRVAQSLRDMGAGEIPVIFFSGRASEEDLREAREAGAIAYLTKPLDFERLLELVHRIFAEASGPTPRDR